MYIPILRIKMENTISGQKQEAIVLMDCQIAWNGSAQIQTGIM